MKTKEQIEKAIEDIKIQVSNVKLKAIEYEARKDMFMVNLENERLSQYAGQISALEWCLK